MGAEPRRTRHQPLRCRTPEGGALAGQTFPVHPELLPRRSRQTTARLGVAGLRVGEVGRDATGQTAQPVPLRGPSTTAA